MSGTSIRLRNQLSELPRLTQALETFAQQQGLARKSALELELILEELVTNVIRHGYDAGDAREHQIAIALELDADRIRIEVVDDGRPFDPRQAPAPDTTAPLEERPVGGLGLHLVRRLVDGLEHERRDGRNHLVLWKRTAVPSGDI